MNSKAKWDYYDDDGDREVDEEVDGYDDFDVDDDGLFLMYLTRISHVSMGSPPEALWWVASTRAVAYWSARCCLAHGLSRRA